MVNVSSATKFDGSESAKHKKYDFSEWQKEIFPN